MHHNKKLLLGVFMSLQLAGNHSIAMDGIPVVPASVMKKNVSTPPPVPTESIATATGQKKYAVSVDSKKPAVTKLRALSTNTKHVIRMEPGVNQIIPIAIGHPNRIITPFANPEITSTSLGSGSDSEGGCGDVCIKDNVIYVATNKKTPVTMFITESGTQSKALSLTMVPRKIPPREVRLSLGSDSSFDFHQGSSKAKAWEKSQPYVETIRGIFRKIAKNEIPQGYTMGSIPSNIVPPSCSSGTFSFDFSNGQYVSGHNLSVFVGLATNVSGQVKEFKEAVCGNWDVAAVTAWPRNVLNPAESTEVYIAVKQKRRSSSITKRPSLLGGNQ